MKRRDLFRDAGRAGLALGLAAAGRPALAAAKAGNDDITLMNTALALEHQAIWAYGLAGGSGLLSAKAKEVGLLFQGSHELHRDLLAEAVKQKGGSPVEPLKDYKFGVPLANEKDVLELAFKLEIGAARVYLYVVDRFQDRALSASAGKDSFRRGPARDRAAQCPRAGARADVPADRVVEAGRGKPVIPRRSRGLPDLQTPGTWPAERGIPRSSLGMTAHLGCRQGCGRPPTSPAKLPSESPQHLGWPPGPPSGPRG